MRKKTLKIICFILILIFLLHRFGTVFSFKYGDGIYPLTTFYKEKEDSIDVICFGSSHIFENINTGVLWNEYGIASFDLCGSIQPIWNTYYYMKEALKTQKPKVMVVDVYGVVQEADFIDSSRIIKNNFGLKFSEDKINSIKASAPQEEWLDYILEYPTYHSRYSELSSSDFKPHLGIANWDSWKGFGLNTETEILSQPQDFYTDEVGILTDKVELYLNKIITLCQNEQIPLLFIKTPYYTSLGDQKKYNRVAEIAYENNIPFINYNFYYKEIGLDFSSDYADVNHLNHRGNIKFTKYFAQFIKENYDIPDRRGNPDYNSYEVMASDYNQLIYNQTQKEIVDIGNYLNGAQNDNFVTVYSISGDYRNIQNYIDVKNSLSNIGINLNKSDKSSVWVIQNNNVLFKSESKTNYAWHYDLNKTDSIMIKSPVETTLNPVIYLNSEQYVNDKTGLNIMIYDTFTESLVEAVTFSINGDMLSYEKEIGRWE